MTYRELRVPPPLDALIECVWFLSAAPRQGGTPAAEQRILPDGCIELVCHFGDRFLAVSRDGLPSPQASCFVVGVLTSPLTVVQSGRADTMGVRFRPGCAHRFIPCPLTALTDRAVDLDDLWGAAARDLWERLAAAPDDSARIALVSGALRERLARADTDRVTAAAVADLVRSGGRASVAAIAARTGVTTRHLQRRFAQRVGASPKMLARILRFQNTLRLRLTGPDERTDWVRVACECGYADQSHLIRDYAEFAGETPASLRAAEGELSSYFTAPQRLAALFDTRRYG
jgi:AraC-like DNA-binding protein